jgi:hypothetical protein
MPSRKAEIADAIVQLLHDELDDEIIPIIALRAIAKLHVHSTGAERVLRGILACRPEPCLRDEAQAALEALESVANSSEARSPAGRG